MRRASILAVRSVQDAVISEISDATTVSRAASLASSPRLTNPGPKTYPSAAAREGSVRTSSLISIALRLPSRSQAQQCQGRRPFQELFQ
jgi:hypothetical protein